MYYGNLVNISLNLITAQTIYLKKNVLDKMIEKEMHCLKFTCFTVASSVSGHAITAITSNKIHTYGSVLAWSGRTLVDV